MENEKRLIVIEMKIAHQDHLMEELHQVIYEQQKVIDKLEEKTALLAKRFEAMGTGDSEIGNANEKPPHY